MYEVIWQKNNGIEILVKDKLNGSEFRDIVHQLESLAAMHSIPGAGSGWFSEYG